MRHIPSANATMSRGLRLGPPLEIPNHNKREEPRVVSKGNTNPFPGTRTRIQSPFGS